MRYNNAKIPLSNSIVIPAPARIPVVGVERVVVSDCCFKISSRSVSPRCDALIFRNRSAGIARSSEVEAIGDDDEEDDGLCPVDCVKEFKTEEELRNILDKATADGSLVVVDFYRRSCGSCKYIEQGFSKLCKGSGDEEESVVFLKHDVMDEYDEQSEVAELLKIKTVPLFHFYKNGVLVDAFPTRDKEKITSAILKYASPDL